MAQLTDAALAHARGHVARIAQRVEAAGFGSSTLARLQADLEAPGPVLAPSDRLTQLQFRAAELGSLLSQKDPEGVIAGNDLPLLRLLLTGAGVTHVPSYENQPVPRTADAAAELAAVIAEAQRTNSTYVPGALP